MCELFAMSSRVPATLGLSLGRLARHGGVEGPHKDGWGLACYEQRDCLLLREPRPACESLLLRFVDVQGVRTCMAVSHLRLATFGARSLQNTQPFVRELGGRSHVFAHNGDFPQLLEQPAPSNTRFRPIGDSDSERAFCILIEGLAPLWEDRDEPPPLEQRLAVIADFSREMRKLGPANFIYADADALFIHAHRRTQPDGVMRPPGLYLLQRSCWESAPELKDAGVRLQTVRQDVALIASLPLTDELWEPLGEGDLIALRNGRCHDIEGRWRTPEDVSGRAPSQPRVAATG
ncbi:putative glutamine amidotransferase [Thiorhodovibrio winogradskyi]|uniref:Glutamine amidotransferase n=1 Tax=Thiorhodovibrio winogradskyi TaxID=77007 RepID=A0ABZ0S9V1_9GAMM|nr:class II glutamine amidotransferase [Thiorhodovibrio winogradskyi]